MDIVLSAVEARVLGALVEKDITTPEYYPLSLNALVNACNQKNNREPVMNLDESEVRDALSGLQAHRLAGAAGGADSRVTKYEHRLQEVFNFDRRETAVLCVLLLRGPQTPGELRGRTERMYRFETLEDVQGALQKLMGREPALVKVLPRAPGTKESRYAHLLCGEVEGDPSVLHGARKDGAASDGVVADPGEIASVRSEVAELRREIEGLKAAFAEFRKQFE